MPMPKQENETPKKARKKPSTLRTRRSNSPGDELGKYKTQTTIVSFFSPSQSPLRFQVKSERQGNTDAVCPKEARKALFTTRLPACRSLASAEPIVITDDEDMDRSSLENYHLKTKTPSGGANKLKVSLSRKFHKIKSPNSLAPINSKLESSSSEPPRNTGGGELKISESSTSSLLTSENCNPVEGPSPRKRFRKQQLSQTYRAQTSAATLNATGDASQALHLSSAPSKRCLVETNEISLEHGSGFSLLESRGTTFKVCKVGTSSTSRENRCSTLVNASSSVLVSHKDTSGGSSKERNSSRIRVKTKAEIITAAETAGLDEIDWHCPVVEEIELNSPLKKTAVPVTPRKRATLKNCPSTPTKLTSSGSTAADSVSVAANGYSSPQKHPPQSPSKTAVGHSGPSTRVVSANSTVPFSHKDAPGQGSVTVSNTSQIRSKTESIWGAPMEEEVELTSPTKQTTVPTTPQKNTPLKNYPCTPKKSTNGSSEVGSSVSAASQLYSAPCKQPQSPSKTAIGHSGPSPRVVSASSTVPFSHKDAPSQGSVTVSNTSQIHVKTESIWSAPMEEEVELTTLTKQTTVSTTPLKNTPLKNYPCTPKKSTNGSSEVGSSVSAAAQVLSTPPKRPPHSPSKAGTNCSGPSTPVKRSPYKRLKKGSPQKSPLKLDSDAMIGSLVLKHSILECKRYAQMATKCNYTIKKVANDYMSLFDREKVLLHKLLVRKWAWIRVVDMKYDKIVDSLVGSLDVLCNKGFLEDISRNEPLDVVLGQLKRPELETLSKNYEEKKTGSSKKDDLVNRLCKFVNAQGSLGFTKKSLKTALADTAFSLLGKCVRIREDTRTILQKIFEASMSPLYLEGQFYSFQQRLSSMERLMSEVKFEGRKLIPFPLSDFQLFLSPAQFDEFITSVILKFDILCAKDEKDNARGVELAKDARATLLVFLANPVVKEFLDKTPRYIWRYTAGSNYTSALDVGIDFLKRGKLYEDAILAIDVLLAQGQFRKHSRGRWYAEKVMIMDKHLKAPAEAIYPILIAGLQDDLTPLGHLELSKKAEGIINKKKGGLSLDQKKEIRELMRIPRLRHSVKEIKSTEAPNVSTGTRQTFVEFSGCGERTYLNVEQVARNSYMAEFPEGMHDEGSFLKNIILAAFWPVIYMPKENMFVSKYQNAPLDWGTHAFYRNRKQEFADHISRLRRGGIDGVMQQITDVVTVYANHHSLVSWFNVSFDMLPTIKNIITCLTLDKFLKLAEYLLESFRERRSGWPDLTLWNTVAGKFKLVEVKSPNDELSFKQIVWLEKLAELGIDVEECRVNASNKGKKRKAQASNIPSDYSQEL